MILIHIINPVDKTQLSRYTSHRRSTTVSLETYPSIQIWHGRKLIDAPSLVNLNFVAATCRRCVHTLWQGCLCLFCRCDMSVCMIKLVWFRATDRSETMIFTCHKERFVAATCRGDVSQRFVASCVSALRSPIGRQDGTVFSPCLILTGQFTRNPNTVSPISSFLGSPNFQNYPCCEKCLEL